ncbi:hypothetical protein ACFXP7_08435 [Microbacterium sp. P06]|uniref:hypothetical protein n=1 Tax=Microbacterium sp. P06 TaxID=3366949 RepID=UPI003746F939
MIAAGVLLLTVGLADLARQFLGDRSRGARIAASIVTVIVLSAVATSVVTLPLVAVVALVALGWLALMPSTNSAAIAGFWPAIGLAISVALLVVFAPGAAEGWGAQWWGSTTTGMSFPPAKLVLAAGVVAFLLESANIVVRVALQIERGDRARTSVAAPSPTPVRRRGAGLLARLRRPVPVTPPAATKQLRGGRLIGPLERLFIVGLIFTSAVALVAAFIAAKGIVRFPEIQKDNAGGTQAEYFLVGSMASWGIALLAAGLLWAVGATPRDFGIS